jgi:uncharacterized membrane protein YagU involved in acid resistance
MKNNINMNHFVKVILLITLLAGTLDLLSAFVHIYINTGKIATWMGQGIASALLGREQAFQGGWATGFLGFFLHYLITFLFTLFYFLMYPRLPILSRNKYLSGIVYGWLVFVIMNFVVLPLSALPSSSMQLTDAIVGLIMLPIVIGLPISIGASRYYKTDDIRLQPNVL